MSDQPTSLFDSGSGSVGSAPGSGLGGATTQPLDRPKRRELTWNRSTDFGLVLLRFAVGGVIFAHGMQHVFGLWGGVGLPGLSNALTAFGFRNVNILVWLTALTELVGGAAVVLGLLTPLAAAGLLALMINAVLLKAVNGFFIAGPPGAGAVELEVVLGLGAAALVLTGAGRTAPDSRPAWNRRPAPWGVLVIVGVAAALLVFFLLRQR
jgi:putative oxidoreductase